MNIVSRYTTALIERELLLVFFSCRSPMPGPSAKNRKFRTSEHNAAEYLTYKSNGEQRSRRCVSCYETRS